ncbi:MAG: hypothetical protein B7Y50_04890 [Hydrogenophilales bacterium 28-61-11]|nr:MAG: hypothetical protein B7Y50_04890 [Hydrogenophilales bacterium 28-61-11]OYZ58541.1 MAG: hypothetical protein B7Y21_02890 [Hydrogenophilales bacterium 16-61-112]OZA50434.1 MAG: hypothetical protein B7X81_01245 [Hydrogenophilales bacterium 17-61-76]
MMKTERIEFVAPPGLKSRLKMEAAKSKMSVGELIRQRFEPNDDELELARLTSALRESTTEARRGLTRVVNEIAELVADLRSRRAEAGR